MSQDTVTPTDDNQSQGQAPAEKPEDSQDLDSLLSEYEAGSTEQPPEKPPEKDNHELRQLRERLDTMERDRLEAEANKAIGSAVEKIKELGELSVSNKVVQGYLEVAAREDARLITAFQQRMTKPKEFEKVLEKIAEQIKGDLGPDRKLSDDSAAVRNAVKNQDSKITDDTPSNQKMSQMSDREFREYKASLG